MLCRVSLCAVKNNLLTGVQKKLQLWAGRPGHDATPWADTVVSPREADGTAQSTNDPAADSQYLTGFDSQFVDDPALVENTALTREVDVQPGRTDAASATAPGRAALEQAAPVLAEPWAAEPILPASTPGDGSAGASHTRPRPAADAAAKAPAAQAQIGRFAVKKRLAAGSLGPVYEAWDSVQQCPVVVRTVQIPLGPDLRALLDDRAAAVVKSKLEQRVLSRARAMLTLRHANIATVVDVGTSAQGVYIAAEQHKGRDMRELLARGWNPRPSVAALVMRRVAEGLACAHAKGVGHGDINPANIVLDDQAQPKLLNFGIAQLGRGLGLHQAETSPGVLRYLAPEQLLDGTADARTDVRAVGVVLYELLAMVPAFGGKTAAEVARAVVANRPTPVHDMRTNSSRSLADIAVRAMATDPGHRYDSADDLVKALALWSDRHAARKARPANNGRTGTFGYQPGRHRKSVKALKWAFGAALGGTALLWLLMPILRNGVGPLVDGVAARFSSQGPGQALAAPPTSLNPADKADAPSAAAIEPPEAADAGQRMGSVLLEVSPAAQVSVNGVLTGTTPPLTRLKLPEGNQSLVLRSEGFDPYYISVQVRHGQAVELRHRFTR